VKGTTLVLTALVVALALPGGYAALGGGRYRPSGVENPCEETRWKGLHDFDELAERLAETALDAAACRLDLSRQTLVLVVARGGSEELARRLGLGRTDLDRAIRSGIDDAIDEAQAHGAIGFVEASFLRARARDLSVETLIGLLIDRDQRRRLAKELESGTL
jgi:hypothetical protein